MRPLQLPPKIIPLLLQRNRTQESIGFISRLATRADSTRRGIGLASYGNLSGSTETKSLFTVSNNNISATNVWKGRFILIGSDSSGSELGFKYVELSGTDNRSATFDGLNAVIIWERDPVIPSVSIFRPTATWDAPQNEWTTVPGMSTTLEAGTTSVSVNGDVYFTNVNRGSTYGVRVLVNGTKVMWSWQSSSFGPLTSLGNPTWSVPLNAEFNAYGGQTLQVQVLCGNPNGYKRRVTTDTQVAVTSYIQA